MPVTNGPVYIYQDIDLSLTENLITPVVHVRQYDHKSRKIRCTFYANHLEYTIPSNVIYIYVGTRPDGCLFQYSSENSNNDKIALDGNNRIIITITDFMTEVPGKYPVDIVFVDNTGDILGSFSFLLSVESAAAKNE